MKYFLLSSRSGIFLVRNIRQRALPRTSYDEGKTEIIKFVQKRHERPKRDSQFFDEDLQNLTKLDAADLLKERERFKLRRQEMINTQRNFDNIPIVDQAVIMFPGIGHQHLKMGEKVIDNAASLRLFQEANEILNFDLLNLCLNGPKTLLDQPINATLATFVSSLAAFEKMKSEQPDLMERFTDCAGFGIGEFTALVAADVLKFTDALKVLKNYAQAAQECAQIVPSGMLTIRTCAKSQLRKALTEAKEYSKSKGEPPMCDIAAYLFSHVKVIGGTMKSLEHFAQNAEHFQIQVIKRLPVFAAYNTAVMKQAATELHNFFPDSSMIQVPQINVYSNYSGRPHAAKPHQIRRDLIRQITKPVKWEQIAQELFRKHKDFNFPSYFEVGPGKQLGTLLNQVSKKTQKTYLNYPA